MRWTIPVFLAACAPHRRVEPRVEVVPSVTWEEWKQAHGGELPELPPEREAVAGAPALVVHAGFQLGDHGIEQLEAPGLGSGWRQFAWD